MGFQCPDEFLGFYPHLISCDKYWHCKEGIAELKTCGNGLGFMDTDDTFTLEQCAELHLVESGLKLNLQFPQPIAQGFMEHSLIPKIAECSTSARMESLTVTTALLALPTTKSAVDVAGLTK